MGLRRGTTEGKSKNHRTVIRFPGLLASRTQGVESRPVFPLRLTHKVFNE